MPVILSQPHVNTWRPKQNGRHFADDMFKCIFLNEIVWIPIEISLKFVTKGSINNNPPLFQIMDWRRPGDKPLSEPIMVSSLTHICVTRPQWVNRQRKFEKNMYHVQFCGQSWASQWPSTFRWWDICRHSDDQVWIPYICIWLLFERLNVTAKKTPVVVHLTGLLYELWSLPRQCVLSEAKTRWPPGHKQCFQIHFLQRKLMYFLFKFHHLNKFSRAQLSLTHCGRVMHICVSKLGHHWFR